LNGFDASAQRCERLRWDARGGMAEAAAARFSYDVLDMSDPRTPLDEDVLLAAVYHLDKTVLGDVIYCVCFSQDVHADFLELIVDETESANDELAVLIKQSSSKNWLIAVRNNSNEQLRRVWMHPPYEDDLPDVEQ
jgi:hypothetical protein